MFTTLIAALLVQGAAAPASAPVAQPAADPASDSVLAGSEYTRLPESWELVYDVAISPYLDDYKRCLGYNNLELSGVANVEKQHRAAVMECAKLRETAIEQSNAAMVRRGRQDSFTPDDVVDAFKAVGYIFIERGRNLDDQMKLRKRAIEEQRQVYAARIAARDAAEGAPDRPEVIDQFPLPKGSSDVED